MARQLHLGKLYYTEAMELAKEGLKHNGRYNLFLLRPNASAKVGGVVESY